MICNSSKKVIFEEKVRMEFEILTDGLLQQFTKAVKESPFVKLDKIKKTVVQVDYFEFYKSVSSVYSSKIEGEDIEFDSYFKYKFCNVKFQPNYTKKVDDLFAAYDFIEMNSMNLSNVQKIHGILSASLLPKSQQGLIRTNPMFVINNDDQIEYVAAHPIRVATELGKLFRDIEILKMKELNPFEIFYYAAFIHLVFVKIHPFQDGNGRTARLLEKWFLLEKIGQRAKAILLEKNYYIKLNDYYRNLRKLGIEYEQLDYSKSLEFLGMTVTGIETE
jgi:Fic family protein